MSYAKVLSKEIFGSNIVPQRVVEFVSKNIMAVAIYYEAFQVYGACLEQLLALSFKPEACLVTEFVM